MLRSVTNMNSGDLAVKFGHGMLHQVRLGVGALRRFATVKVEVLLQLCSCGTFEEQRRLWCMNVSGIKCQNAAS